MRVIIAGSRSIEDYSLVESAVRESGFEISEVVSGTARGADQLGERYAADYGLWLKRFPAMWYNEAGVYDNAAGYKRNEQMAQYADALIAIHDGESKGTQHMIDLANKYDLQIYVKICPKS